MKNENMSQHSFFQTKDHRGKIMKKTKDKLLLNISHTIKKCLSSQCGNCRENCPAYISFQLDSYFSRGKNLGMRAYFEGDLNLDEVIDVAYACTNCRYCRDVCLVGEGAYSYIKDLRNLLVKNKIVPKKINELKRKILENNTPFDKKDSSWAENWKNKGTVGYFPGCTIQAKNPKLAENTLKLLQKIGIRAVPIINPCCGSPLIKAGFKEEAREIALEFLKEIRKRNIKKIISSCPGCVSTLKNEYPNLVEKTNFLVFHIIEILNKNIKFFKGKKKGIKVVYHDPCHLARELRIVEQPRNILEKLGCKVIEFEKNMENSLCCGSGASFSLNYPKESSFIAKSKIKEVEELEADILVSSCPMCEYTLKKAGEKKINVLDVLELIQ